MSVEGGYSPEGSTATNISALDYVDGALTYGRGHETHVAGLESAWAEAETEYDDDRGLLEMYVDLGRTGIEKSRDAMRGLGRASVAAINNLANPEIPKRVRAATALGLSLVITQTGASAAQAFGTHPADLKHNPDSAHTFHLEAVPPSFVTTGDKQDLQQDLISGDGGPDPDDDPAPSPTPHPTATRNHDNDIFLALVAKNVKVGSIKLGTTPPPTETPTPEPSPTATPTDLPPSPKPSPSPSPSPSPTASPTPSPTAVPPMFNPDGMARETVFDANADGRGPVRMTTGGVDDEDWIGNQLTWAQHEVLAGTGFQLDGEPRGVEVQLVARPEIEPAQEGSKNLWEENYPYFGIEGAYKTTDDGHILDLDTRVAFDPVDDRWEVSGNNLCEDDPNITGNEDTVGALSETAATVTLLAREDKVRNEDHFIRIETSEGVCEDVVDAFNFPAQEGQPYHDRHAFVNLPANTRGLDVASIVRLGDEIPLDEAYPQLAIARDYVDRYGGPDVAFQGTNFWRSPEAWQLLRDGYLEGIAYNALQEYGGRFPRLSQVDLLARIAHQQEWDLYIPSLVNPRGGTPQWISTEQKYGFPAIDNVMREVGRDAFNTLYNRWNGANFPGLMVAAVANPANDEILSLRMRRHYYDYTWEKFWSSGPTSHAQDIMRRVGNSHPGRATIEQYGLVLPQNPDIVSNASKILGEVAKEVDPAETTLVLPVFEYPSNTTDASAILEQLQTDLSSRANAYGEVYVPVYPSGSLQDRIALSTAIINARGLMPRLRVAIPGDWGENTTADIIGSTVFTNAMRERMVVNGRP